MEKGIRAASFSSNITMDCSQKNKSAPLKSKLNVSCVLMEHNELRLLYSV